MSTWREYLRISSLINGKNGQTEVVVVDSV